MQQGATEEAFEARRIAVVRGQVITRDGDPLPGVTITIKDHPEFGWTKSRDDGWYDLAVNGGGYLVSGIQPGRLAPGPKTDQRPLERLCHSRNSSPDPTGRSRNHHRPDRRHRTLPGRPGQPGHGRRRNPPGHGPLPPRHHRHHDPG